MGGNKKSLSRLILARHFQVHDKQEEELILSMSELVIENLARYQSSGSLVRIRNQLHLENRRM
jgi:hypothetical protein